MDGAAVVSDDQLDPPLRLYDRLRQFAGYTWDESKLPIHTSYDVWQVSGTRFVSPYTPSSSSPHNASSPGSASRLHPSRPSPSELPQPTAAIHSEVSSERSTTTPPALTASVPEISYVEEPVMARISYHVLREERVFHIAKSLTASADPRGDHIAKPLDLLRLSPHAGDRGPILVAIYQDPGPNAMYKLLDLGPAFYKARKVGESYQAYRKEDFRLEPPIHICKFMDFAIGAAQCLEILHHSQGMIHGEIRGDTFHFNSDTNKVRLVSFGSGVRSFEHGLTSTGWTTLSRELGAKNKLLYISPEQTGRMTAEPDSRTDIYSLGVLLWTLLTQQQVYEGETPLDIVQGVLRRRIPNVSLTRLDVPDVMGRIIQKCTAKSVGDRYHSASGLRHDLCQVQGFLCEDDRVALREWRIGSKDVSSFFMLPTMMIGRHKERAGLVKVIERVATAHAVNHKGATNRFSDGSSLSELIDGADHSSEGASSAEGNNRRSGSFTHTTSSDPRQSRSSLHPSMLSDAQTINSDYVSLTPQVGSLSRFPRPWERHHSGAVDMRSLNDVSIGSGGDTNRQSAVESSGSSSLSRQLGSAKFRRRGHCEIVLIEGAAGLGKSFLVQSVLPEARRRGYCATAKFETARRTAFGPLLRLLSSLFKQVWGERNTETQFHMALKQYVRPVWPVLHKHLGLPEFLLGPVEPSVGRSASSAQSRNLAQRMKRRGSSPGISPSGSSPVSARNSVATSSSQDFLRAGTSTKSMRLINTFLDVLRMFSAHKFICFCLDDLHFADDESLELITQIIGARMKMVIIMTYRPDEMTAEKVQRVIHPPESEGGPTVTQLTLNPLTEEDIVQYVSTTICRPKEEVLPLALVIQSKTAGNPFYMREMLNACHRKKCIWYDYRDSQWHFDLDRLFEQFQGEKDYDVLDTGFITRRLNELPPASRSILAWAALLGQSFSFDLICRLLSSEFHSTDDACDDADHHHTTYSLQEAIQGLQAAIQAYILVPSEADDRFRFAHDRYIQAASALKECNARKMHYVIAQTLMKYYAFEVRARDSTALHICESVDIIRREVKVRQPFRKLLLDCAQVATENGARPTAAKYYSSAVALLQPKPWAEGDEDVSYNETLQLYLHAAECSLFMGHHAAANGLLATVFKSAKTALDKAPAYVLQSRIFAQNGDAESALSSLKECLVAMGVKFDDNPSFQQCDKEFERLSVKIQSMDRSEVLDPTGPGDATLASIGAVLVETISAAWWSDCLRFYHLSLVMLDMHLTCGAFAQSGMAFLHVAIVALSRFNMAQFAVDLGAYSLELLDKYRDPFSLARGYMIFANFLGHIHFPLCLAVTQLEGAVEYAAAAGDRISTILSFGLSAQLKFFASENCSDLEGFCQYGCEEIPNWHQDTRGGTLLIAIRQTCRALQGKTRTREAEEVLTDDQHNTAAYKQWLRDHTHNGNRSILFYETLELVSLFLFGHYERAIEVGARCYKDMHLLWSCRNSRLTLLFYGLSLADRVLRQLQDPRLERESLQPEVDETVRQLEELNKMIKDWEVVSNVNYLAWSKFMDAQIEELRLDTGLAIRLYEEGLDHAAEHSFVFEEALGNYLMGGVFLRRKARRWARAALWDAVSLYRQMGAVGVAGFIEEEHSLLLRGPSTHSRKADAAVQADFAADGGHVPYRAVDGEEGDDMGQNANANGAGNETMADARGDRIGVWRGSMHMQQEAGAGLPALDMIDLHAILLSSQAMSSVLQVDELLKTMCDAILQTCGGSATLASIVVQEQETDSSGWCLAASGDPEKGAAAHIPGLPLAGTSLVAENVVLYCTRFRESVFIPDLICDERFGNVSEAWLQRNPLSRAVIAIPICHGEKPLLGVLYLEGHPGSFTDRNVTVLQLLVNQIGISYSNALAMKAVEKVSAENKSVVALQKRALQQALEAETKAKNAEAEANRNVKLAEEAARAKSIFLANVSHELRTPLNGVIGNSELLRDSDLDREQLEMADSIRVSADLLLTVINDILDFSRMEADKMKLYISAFNPDEMVREVVRAASYSNREKTSQKNVRIIQDINLPPMLIYGDPIRLHQVLGNLIGNSLKFTERGSITIGARIDDETDESVTVTFWVEDTGIGIPPQQLAKLFQPFSQADASTARKYGGSGLGLSICKSLIETMMKGKISLASEENVGTRAWFTVSFDKASPDAVVGDRQASAQPLLERKPSSGDNAASTTTPPPPNLFLDLTRIPKDRLRICIAEDNPINQKIAIQYVQRLGYRHVQAYENGEKALQGLRAKALEDEPYHIILMDVQMPVLDGYETTKMIRRDAIEAVRKILVIAMTASAIHGDREKCLAAGMNDYLAKPVRCDVLKKKLEAYVGHPDIESPTSKGRPGLDSAPSSVNTNGSATAMLSPSPRDGDNRDNPTPITRQPSGTLTHSRRTSSDHRSSSDGASLDAPSSSSTAPAATAKRQPRKLTKNRAGSDAVPPAMPPVVEDEKRKHKGLLTKKAPPEDEGQK